ncbi:MBOAT family O-acyltransferase [Tardiphaga sp. vice278]|uniref:MBOAT family O-acyltransferase n=1 Tax=Tardiphaga sp. vice278 TaxID=2592815 RepID=UPI001165AF99|nr:MBOAT family protein [Tardiphaga sp. vice278]QDM17945.1 MBOAT family protein [Tardiphaga sp. vice278]
MSFSSPGFLFAFMPVFFVLYFVLPHALRNAWLLVTSLAFYSIDGGSITIVLIASVVVNYVIGLAIERTSVGAVRTGALIAGVVLNLLPLLYFKYANFLFQVADDAGLLKAGVAPLALRDIVLPAGISFFTFQGLSYIIDIYRRETRSAPTMVDFGMYHTLFPQLVAGPIVRYREVEDRIVTRPVVLGDVEAGILRFCVGLAKKIIIADSMGVVADRMFGLGAEQMTFTAAWLGALAYTLQIFFDFSGYSDMAIGLGRALGFRFPENFNQPYRSLSITEFWRRWHMTLSRWFRDYVYIPLGGNRGGAFRTYSNLFIIFVLCGLWHGAAYTFLVWGVYHGALLVIERVNRNMLGWTLPSIVSWPATLFLVVVGWVFFRATSIQHAVTVLRAMAGFGAPSSVYDLAAFITPDKVVFFLIGCVISVWPMEGGSRLPVGWSPATARALQHAGALVLFVYSAALIAANGFNPFIYFRF